MYCCRLAFETVYLYFFMVETKGLTLEETAALFDGEDAMHLQKVAHDAADLRHEDYDEKSSKPEEA